MSSALLKKVFCPRCRLLSTLCGASKRPVLVNEWQVFLCEFGKCPLLNLMRDMLGYRINPERVILWP